MAQNANKTEHSGAKKGRGAYWGRKKDAKEESSKKRRADEREQVKDCPLASEPF
ncbi:hypothetical protein [Idiomarina sp. HP20-50]|uniref:hypothetical protein n=1 Tax=Idiomarina sp. HP20-50 TaxID=3070813 RepID=UPI00294AE110|nr:hypothetical protein [Idiomarina sp. HP20-50]MDV6315619.1 hypothetical protein [Idiomarina sp. HP20-50]